VLVEFGPLKIQIGRTKASGANLITHLPQALSPVGMGGWWGVVRESFAGAWQRNITLRTDDVLAYSTVWACITLIASDISKLCVELMKEDAEGINVEVDVPAFSPVLREPNHFQHRLQFYEQWVLSKLIRGNTYVLLERDGRNAVIAMYVLDSSRVQVLVAPDGSVFYDLGQDYLSGVESTSVRVPASEIIHDRWNCLYHPLVGLSPIFACGSAAMQALQIESNSTKLFANGSQPGGVLTAPGPISNEVAARAQQWWEDNFAGPQNIGKVAVLGDGLKYEPMTMTAVDSEIIKQLNLSDERICRTFHVPGYMVGVGGMPNYNNIEALNQQYYSQCLQVLIESIEACLDKGLGLVEAGYESEMDLDGLLRMDSATKMTAATTGVKGMIYTPNEARKMFNRKPLKGGDTVYGQEQDHSVEWLQLRDQQGPPEVPSAPNAIMTPTKEMLMELVDAVLATKAASGDETDEALAVLDAEWAA